MHLNMERVAQRLPRGRAGPPWGKATGPVGDNKYRGGSSHMVDS